MRFSPAGVLIALALAVSGCATGGRGLLEDTAEAMGGKSAILAVNTMIIEGHGQVFEYGQSRTPYGPPPGRVVEEYRKFIDFENKRWFLQMDLSEAIGVDNGVGFDRTPDRHPARTTEAVARNRQHLLFQHPIFALRAAFDPSAVLSDFRDDGTTGEVKVKTESGWFVLYVNLGTMLPSRVLAMVDDPVLGNISLVTWFDDYVRTDGLLLPRELTVVLEKFTIETVDVLRNRLNPALDPIQAPVEVRSVAPPAEVEPVMVAEVARGVWYLTGGTHYSVLVEFSDHLVLIEAPLNDDRTREILAKAGTLRPDKPLRYVINTHHHFDHTGGIRTAVAEGLTVIAHEGSRTFLEDVVQREHSIAPDALFKNPKPLKLETVKDKLVLQDSMRRLELYHVEGAHAATLLSVYLPAERIVVVAEADTAVPQGIRVDRVLPLKGVSAGSE